MSSDKLYEKTKQEPWDSNVKRRVLNWLKHLLHLDITKVYNNKFKVYNNGFTYKYAQIL